MFPAAVVLVITVGTTVLIVATGEGDPAPAAGSQPLIPTGTASAAALGSSAVAASAVPPATTAPAPAARTTAAAPADAAPARFTTLSPGSALPSGAQCASCVRAQP